MNEIAVHRQNQCSNPSEKDSKFSLPSDIFHSEELCNTSFLFRRQTRQSKYLWSEK